MELAINHRTHTHTHRFPREMVCSLQPLRWTAPANVIRMVLKDCRELSWSGNTLELVPREMAQCVLLWVGSMAALKLCLRGSSGSAQAEPGVMAAVPNPLEQPPQCSLRWRAQELPCSGKSLALVPGVELWGNGSACWALLPGKGPDSTCCWGGDREEPGGHLVLTELNPPYLLKSTLHPSHLLPQGLPGTGRQLWPQGKQTEHCAAFHSVPKPEVVSAFYLFHKQEEW